MKALRFGQVASLRHLNREQGKGLKSPSNRILYSADGTTFFVTGQDDIGLVDEMLNTIKQQADKSPVLESLMSGLVRFLYNKAHNTQYNGDVYTAPKIELL